jgi:hypothetical protein
MWLTRDNWFHRVFLWLRVCVIAKADGSRIKLVNASSFQLQSSCVKVPDLLRLISSFRESYEQTSDQI